MWRWHADWCQLFDSFSFPFLSSFSVPLPHLLEKYSPSSFPFPSHICLFSVVRLKSLQAQEDARHKTSENRRAEISRTDRRPSGKRNSERPQDVVSNYEKHLKNLKDEIAVLSAEKSGLQARSDKPLGTFDFVSFWVRSRSLCTVREFERVESNP